MNLLIILYLVGFLRTLAVIALIYFGIRVVTRYILPLLVDKGVKNMQEKMYKAQKQKQQSGRQEGEVTIEKNRSDKSTDTNSKGEYVDFEEVD